MEIDIRTQTLVWNTEVIGTQSIPVEISFGPNTPNIVVDPATATQGEMIDLYYKGMWHLFIIQETPQI